MFDTGPFSKGSNFQKTCKIKKYRWWRVVLFSCCMISIQFLDKEYQLDLLYFSLVQCTPSHKLQSSQDLSQGWAEIKFGFLFCCFYVKTHVTKKLTIFVLRLVINVFFSSNEKNYLYGHFLRKNDGIFNLWESIVISFP